MPENYKRLTLKRKSYSRGNKNQKFKRYKKTPKYIKDNPENQVAKEKEKDAYHFTDSEEDSADDLGMGIDISDLPFLDDNLELKQKKLIALTQDSVQPLFTDEASYDEAKLDEGLAELKLKSFRANQKETIKRILQGKSTLFISPTGSGKSLCYQLPALLYWRYKKYITIVVSPLISLMEDQMTNFPVSLKAVSLHSGYSKVQRRRSIEQLVNGDAQVVFVSPEAIIGGVLDLEDLKNFPPVGFVCIDEAHCLSEWSHNFRPAYLQFFKILHEQMSIKTYLGLTATATKSTSLAIARNLHINSETDIIGSTTIPDNLLLSVSCETNKDHALIELLKSTTFRNLTSIIIYCNRREKTERVASRIRASMQNYSSMIEMPERSKTSSPNSKEDLNQSNGSNTSASDKPCKKLTWHAEPYHAGLSTESRKRIQREFIKGNLRVVVATIAFGMGINKSNVRAIIHYDMPDSFEGYVQEIGRAGRDGKPAQCHLFLNADKSDLYYMQRNIYSSVTEEKNLKKLTEMLFKPCTCNHLGTEKSDEIERLNESDPHEISDWHKTTFTDSSVQDILESFKPESIDTNEKENNPLSSNRKSVVRKHRECIGHPVAFGVEEASTELNLKSDSIITLICQLEQAYPQLKIQQYNPIKSTCNVVCPNVIAMEKLKDSSPPITTALFLQRLKNSKTAGKRAATSNRLSFDIINVASRLGKPYKDVIQMLKKIEWELVEKTGKFRKSQIKVTFEGHSYHINAVGDLNSEEKEEINNFLYDFTRLYEHVERKKIEKVFNTMKSHAIEMGLMEDKTTRLEASAKLKASLDSYFDPSLSQQQTTQNEESQPCSKLGEAKSDNKFDAEYLEKTERFRLECVKKTAREFISANGKNYTARDIARIFQGISTPNYPADVWGTNKKFWRVHLDVDFLRLTSIIQKQLSK